TDRMLAELAAFFELVKGRSPFDIAWYCQAGLARASKGLLAATAYSAIEQAMWDAAGHLAGQPTYNLLGGKLRDRLPTYANINRVTEPRTPAGVAATATKAAAEG